MDMKMNMGNYFRLGGIGNFIFKGLKVENHQEFIIACLVVGVVTIILEGLKMLILYLTLLIEQDPLTYAQTSSNDPTMDKSPLFSSLRIPSSLESIRRKRLQIHCLSFMTHVVNVFFGYLLMLAVMSYNVWIALAVIIGSGIGYYIFGAIGLQIKIKYSFLHQRLPTEDRFQINSVSETEQQVIT